MRQPPISSKADFASLSASARDIAAQIAALQKGVESLQQFSLQLAQITQAADQIQEVSRLFGKKIYMSLNLLSRIISIGCFQVSDKFAELATDEDREQPLQIIQEVSDCVEAICK